MTYEKRVAGILSKDVNKHDKQNSIFTHKSTLGCKKDKRVDDSQQQQWQSARVPECGEARDTASHIAGRV